MKNFSYIHIEKLKVWGRGRLAEKQYKPRKYTRYWGVQGCWEHDMRLIDTANADPKRLDLNAIACEETNWKILPTKPQNLEKLKAKNPEFIVQKAKNFLFEKGISPRPEQVKVAMLLCAASPEFLRDGDANKPLNNKHVVTWAKSTIAFLKEKYKDTLLACVIHMDELNPHLTAYLVPALEIPFKRRGRGKAHPNDPKTRWSLNASQLFTPDPVIFEKTPDGKSKKIRQGKGTCSLLQDEYADALQKAGLDLRRGIRRAPYQKGLEHETTKERWEKLSAHIPEVDSIPDNKLREWAKTMALQAANARRLLIEKEHYQLSAQNALHRVSKAVKIVKKLKKEKQSLRKTLAKKTRLPSVEETLLALTGLQPSKTAQGPLLILPSGQKLLLEEKNKFRNLTPEIKGLGNMSDKTHGNGALDAIAYLTGWKSQESMEWIADTFGLDEASATWSESLSQQAPTPERLQNQSHLKNFTQSLNQHHEALWEKVLEKLSADFAFQPALISRLKANRWLGTNKYGHLTITKVQYNELQKPVPAGKLILELPNQAQLSPTNFQHETGNDGVGIISEPNAPTTLITSDPLEGLALKHIHPHSAILLIGKTPGPETEKILELTKKHSKLQIAEPSHPTPTLKNWIQEKLKQGLDLLPIPLGFKSFVEYHTSPQELTPDIKILEFPPYENIKEWNKTDEQA